MKEIEDRSPAARRKAKQATSTEVAKEAAPKKTKPILVQKIPEEKVPVAPPQAKNEEAKLDKVPSND